MVDLPAGFDYVSEARICAAINDYFSGTSPGDTVLLNTVGGSKIFLNAGGGVIIIGSLTATSISATSITGTLTGNVVGNITSPVSYINTLYSSNTIQTPTITTPASNDLTLNPSGGNINCSGKYLYNAGSISANTSVITPAITTPGGNDLVLAPSGNDINCSGKYVYNIGSLNVTNSIACAGFTSNTAGTTATSTTTGTLTINGGLGVNGDLFASTLNSPLVNSPVIAPSGGSTLTLQNSTIVRAAGTASTSTTTGALTVNGGVGINGDLFSSTVNTPTVNAKAISMLTNTAAASAFQLYSGSTSNYISMGIGRISSDLELAVASQSGQFSTSALASGDAIIRNNNSGNLLILNVGATLGSLVLSSPSVNPTSGVNGTALINGGLKVTGTIWTNDTTNTPSITLETTGGTATALNYYEEGTFTLNCSTYGCCLSGGSASVTASFVRVGKMVTISWPDILGTITSSSAAAIQGIGIPTRLSPGTASGGTYPPSAFGMCGLAGTNLTVSSYSTELPGTVQIVDTSNQTGGNLCMLFYPVLGWGYNGSNTFPAAGSNTAQVFPGSLTYKVL